jgi:hypothetical protein
MMRRRKLNLRKAMVSRFCSAGEDGEDDEDDDDDDDDAGLL